MCGLMGTCLYKRTKKLIIISRADQYYYLHAAAEWPRSSGLEVPLRQAVAVLVEPVVFLLLDPHLLVMLVGF